ncbi:MAG: response regulator [Elusimicrobia bacterium]|nr:response regulator [Elusimicrobiota bacterium]MDE2237552.1 response regulator [Elusimicrobiota bacterium]MDE2425533.1 response regulator [Elusimicrobiota bacterium]
MGPEKKVLVVEDELAIVRFLRTSLQENGFEVLEAGTGRMALELAATKKPEAILLDLGLPDRDGLEVLRRLREWSSAPVIILSARGQEGDKIAALDAGADDYLTKPFGVAELMARLRVALRHAERTGRKQEPIYEHEGLKVDLTIRRVSLRKKEIHLSPLQYELLAVLVRNAGRVVSHKQLIKEVWKESGDATPESVRIFVHQLRHKIEPDPVRPKHLKTEPGVGYRLEAESGDY